MAGWTMRGLAVLAMLLALVCIAAPVPALAATFGPDGRPRPDGYPDTPTMAYGPTPTCLQNGVPATCQWYGFAHILYPDKGAECLLVTRLLLSNTTLFAPGVLKPFRYYYLKPYVFDATTNTSYCLYGCFDMSSTTGPVASPTPPPSGSLAPPPPAPSPVAVPTPPPPSVLVTPPPVHAGAPPPPLISDPPPSIPPPDSATTPPPPPAASLPPPPPGGPTVVSLNRAGRILQPTGLVSFIISGALLLVNGLVATF